MLVPPVVANSFNPPCIPCVRYLKSMAVGFDDTTATNGIKWPFSKETTTTAATATTKSNKRKREREKEKKKPNDLK